jgi:DNA-binding response OmpR family regulator/anti-sigma regulatory factor (Ser/Thr protein kinase)
VLEMGRLDKGLRIHRRPTRLASVVQRVLHDLSFQANRCELLNEVPTQLPIIAADPLRIERVLRNLLENAIKFSPQGGTIRVLARLTEKGIVVGVEDQGIGIAPEHLQHIFERFYQVDHTEVPKEGVGLGLSIVRELVRAHNGRVWAESGVGSGTTVYFSLPVDGSSVMPERDSVGGNHIALDLDGLEGGIYPALEHPTILIVEDDHQLRQFLHETLEKQGFAILTTSFGKQVLDLVQMERPDLILLDLTLPDVDGLTVCQQVRRVSNVPIIIITGRTAEHHQVRGLTLGADDYLIKPFTSRELLAHIRAVLRRAQMPGKTETPSPLRFNGLEISPTSHEVISPTGTVKLTPTEHKILWYLASNAGQTLTHEQLLIHVWGFDSEHSSDYLWVIISRLRKKIEPDPGQPRYIMTEPGLGYRFEHAATTPELIG